MNKLGAVIRREYIARVRSKWFLFGTIMVPLLMVGAMALPILLFTREAQREIDVSVVDASGAVLGALLQTTAFREGNFHFVPAPRGDPQAALETLDRWVLERRLAGYLYIPAGILAGDTADEAAEARFWAQEGGSSFAAERLQAALTAAVQQVRARTLGLEQAAVERLIRPVKLAAYSVNQEGEARSQEKALATAHVLGMLVYMAVLIYGAMMLRAAVAEKASKTVEIILSSVRPWELMLGKTLGVGAVGLTQIGVWLLVAAVLLLYVSGAGALAEPGFLEGLPLGFDTLVLFLGLFITGYFLFGGLYAAVGSIASNEQEASQLQVPVTILAVIPILIIPIALNAPGGTTAVVLSWVPFFAPVLFLVRYVLGTVAAWEIALVFALQILSVLLIAWLGGRIYRLGLLMTGKRPTLPELVRWIRHG